MHALVDTAYAACDASRMTDTTNPTQTGPFLGVCTDRSDGEIRYVVSGLTVDEVKSKMLTVLEEKFRYAENSPSLEWNTAKDFACKDIIAWAIDEWCDEFCQILPMP